MKNKFGKLLLTCAGFMASFLYASTASAHIYTGFMVNLSTGAIRTSQVLTLICPATTARVRAEVADLSANSGIMSVTVFKDGNAQTVSDTVQGDGGFGPQALLTAGAGTYYLIASQTAAAFGQYRIQYHCENASGAETTGPAATLTQP